MIAIVIPAHNEESLLGACLDAVAVAAAHPGLGGEDVTVLVICDACDDETWDLAFAHPIVSWTDSTNARSVGAARALGAERVLRWSARWIAFTDADSRVPPDWLAAQMAEHAAGADVVLGGCVLDDGTDLGMHFGGASLGVSAEAYQRAGGFQPLKTGEDAALVTALQKSGAKVVWMGPKVTTSSRTEGRAPGGLAERMRAR